MNLLTNEEDLQRWRENPVTAEFLRYLKDRRETLMKLWGQGQELSQLLQGEAVALGSLIHLDCDDVKRFYEVEDEQ